MRYPLITICSSKFGYYGKARTFCAEVSDLGDYNFKQRVYDDALDIGFEMVSEKTGASRVFLLTDGEIDTEGNIQYWIFECYKPVGKNRLELVSPGIKCLIFND